jgi:hypothetical protein
MAAWAGAAQQRPRLGRGLFSFPGWAWETSSRLGLSRAHPGWAGRAGWAGIPARLPAPRASGPPLLRPPGWASRQRPGRADSPPPRVGWQSTAPGGLAVRSPGWAGAQAPGWAGAQAPGWAAFHPWPGRLSTSRLPLFDPGWAGFKCSGWAAICAIFRPGQAGIPWPRPDYSSSRPN